MTDSEKRELAERHWRYTEGLLARTNEHATPREHYLYVEAGIHFYKHGYDDAVKHREDIK